MNEPFFDRMLGPNDTYLTGEGRDVTRSDLASPFKEYTLPAYVSERLSKKETSLVRRLTRAARRLGAIYRLQVTQQGQYAFWPDGVTQEEIEEAASKDRDIMSPYTNKIRDSKGNLIAIPYNQVYGALIRNMEIPQILNQAAEDATNSRVVRYLQEKARSFTNGRFAEADIPWLEFPGEPPIHAVIGFYDRNLDTDQGVNFAAEAWVGVMDVDRTIKANTLKRDVLKWWEERTGEQGARDYIRVNHDTIIVGLAHDYEWLANSMPCLPEQRLKYGSRMTVFGSAFNKSYEEEIEPAIQATIDPAHLLDSYQQRQELALARLITHEVGHGVGKVLGTKEGLKEIYQTLTEMRCDLFALVAISHLPTFKQEQREQVLAVALAIGKYNFKKYQEEKRVERKRTEYFISSSILLNFLLEKGSVQIKNRQISWENTEVVYQHVEELFEELMRVYITGRADEAQAFLGKYIDRVKFRVYQKVGKTPPVPLPPLIRTSKGTQGDNLHSLSA